MPRHEPQSKGGGQTARWQMVEFVLPAFLVGVAVVGWVLLFKPRQAPSRATPTPRQAVMTRAVPTKAPTLWGTAAAPTSEMSYRGTALPTFTPTPPGVTTPTAGLDLNPGGLKVGGKAVVSGTGGSGLNVRTEASAS